MIAWYSFFFIKVLFFKVTFIVQKNLKKVTEENSFQGPVCLCSRNPGMVQMGVSKKRGTPKSSILYNRVFHEINHPFWWVKSPYFWVEAPKLPRINATNKRTWRSSYRQLGGHLCQVERSDSQWIFVGECDEIGIFDRDCWLRLVIRLVI